MTEWLQMLRCTSSSEDLWLWSTREIFLHIVVCQLTVFLRPWRVWLLHTLSRRWLSRCRLSHRFWNRHREASVRTDLWVIGVDHWLTSLQRLRLILAALLGVWLRSFSGVSLVGRRLVISRRSGEGVQSEQVVHVQDGTRVRGCGSRNELWHLVLKIALAFQRLLVRTER
jgi:hypothetical protein